MTQGRGKRVALGLGIVAAGVLAIAAWVSRPWIRFWVQFEPLGWNAQGYPEYRHRQTGIDFVRFPGGTFQMGAQKDDPNGRNHDPEAFYNEGPVHEVILRPFLIARGEVTQGQWKAVLGSDPSRFKGDDDRPLVNVSWEEIQEFEAKTGLGLPTESQWEYACRSRTSTSLAGKIDDLAWFDRNSGGTTHPVGTKESNGFGLHDLHGNIWEWCEDVYDGKFYGKLESAGPDPVSKTGSGSRVVRGGSWSCVAWFCRSTYRGRRLPDDRGDDLGFRPALPSP